ncbi:unnamed protein product [Vitrella brassicaformis CCMP3155]|uniref:Uncharacterized protein n=2 Tax=Vitrella brassicaformis TaxID=1169539 RepID=A0A0G4EKY6_VITBC|nr:unnamed protein product [Vitrella brassicaformis CCMP3155]|eukprot:CEL97644.1 unnamed protein product [Vitrella brassicaformis CCMP3155]
MAARRSSSSSASPPAEPLTSVSTSTAGAEQPKKSDGGEGSKEWGIKKDIPRIFLEEWIRIEQWVSKLPGKLPSTSAADL